MKCSSSSLSSTEHFPVPFKTDFLNENLFENQPKIHLFLFSWAVDPKKWTGPERLFDHGLEMIYFRFIFEWLSFLAWNSIFFVNKRHFLGLWRMHAATTEKTKIIRTVLISGFLPYPKFQKIMLWKDLFQIYIRTWTSGQISFSATSQKFWKYSPKWSFTKKWVFNDMKLYCCNKNPFIYQSLKEFIKAVPGTTIFDKLLNCPCSSHSPSLSPPTRFLEAYANWPSVKLWNFL